MVDITKDLQEWGIKVNCAHVYKYAAIRDEYALILEENEPFTYSVNFYINGHISRTCGRLVISLNAGAKATQVRKLQEIFKYFQEDVEFDGTAIQQIEGKFNGLFN